MKNLKKLIEGTLTYKNIEFNKKQQNQTNNEINKYLIW